MKKQLTGVALGLVLTAVAVTPAQAQSNNIFQRISEGVRSRVERVSLMLPGDKDGRAVMRQAMVATNSLDSADMNAVLAVDLVKEDATLANVKVTISGPIEMKEFYNPGSYRQALNVAGEFTMQGTTMRANADMRTTKDMVYFKVNEAPVVPYIDLKPVTGKWLKTENTAQASSEGVSQYTPEQQQRFQDAAIKLITDAEVGRAKKETKNGRAVFVIETTLPKQAVIDYVETVLKIQREAVARVGEGEMVAANEEATRESIRKFFDNTGDLKATIWVDRSSYYVSHLEMPLTFKPEKTGNTVAAVNTQANPFASLNDLDTVKVLVTIDMKDFNKSVTFEEPADAQDAREAFQSMTGLGGSAGMTQTTPTELPALTPQQRMQLEKYEKMSQEQKEMLEELKKMDAEGINY